VGLTWEHNAATLFRSVLESVALEYRLYRDTIDSLYPDTRLRELRVTGGGEVSSLWNRLKADILELPVRRITGSHGAPAGAALLAGFGVGEFRSLDRAAAAWLRLEPPLRPRRGVQSFYSQRLRQYAALLQALDPRHRDSPLSNVS
jgi:xylulokinase